MWGFAVLLLWPLVGLFPADADAGEGQRGEMVCAETGAFFYPLSRFLLFPATNCFR